MTSGQTEAQTRNATRINRDTRGRESADKSGRAARSVKNRCGLRSNSRHNDFDGCNKMLPNDAGGHLRSIAASLVEEDTDGAIVVVDDTATGAEGRRPRVLMNGRQAMMVVMRVLRHQLMEAVAQNRDAAINGEQNAGNELMRDSPHGGITPAR